MTILLASLLAVLAGAPASAGFVRASGTEIVDGSGAPLLLRGVNLGGWLLWEAYLIRFQGDGWTESRMKRRVVELVGEEDAHRFFRAYRENYVTKADIRRIAKLGYNVVRVPINARILLDEAHFDMPPGEGWEIIDRLLDWCEAEGVHVVLDMHSAPGGQNPGGISDNEMRAGLFHGDSTTKYRDATVELWRKIATRYRGREIVAAHDLLNEPAVNNEWGGGAELGRFYSRLISAVREVDPDHMIMVEGNWYATDFSMFPYPPLDGNLCYQFHKYWDTNGPNSIRSRIELREKLKAPVWLGETGENSHHWFARCAQVVEEAGIGWCFWPYKRLGGGCVQGVEPPESWPQVSAVLGRREDAPAMAKREMVAGLMGLAEALKLARCREDEKTVRALRGEEEKRVWRVPGRLEAAEYSRCRAKQKGNQGGEHRAGDADIFKDGDELVVRDMDAGDTLEWDVEALGADEMRFLFRYAAGAIQVRVDGEPVPVSGSRMEKGRHVVTVEARRDGAGIGGLEVSASPGRIEAEDFRPGAGKGYGDVDAKNKGEKYRLDEGVDLGTCNEGGHYVGWIVKDEWLSWAVTVPRAGKYDLFVRASSPGGGGPIRMSLNGAPLGAPVKVPGTGWWTNWTDVKVGDFDLPEGEHVLRMDVGEGSFDLDYLLFVPAAR